MDNCHLFVELNLISKIFGHAALVSKASFNGCTSFNKPCSDASPVAACFKMLKFGFNLIDDGLVGQQVYAGEATRLAYGTEEAKEGRDAFLEKRPRDFSQFPKFP